MGPARKADLVTAGWRLCHQRRVTKGFGTGSWRAVGRGCEQVAPRATFGSFESSSASARLHHAARSRLGSSGSSDREGGYGADIGRGRDLPEGLLRGDFLSHKERGMNSALLLKARS